MATVTVTFQIDDDLLRWLSKKATAETNGNLSFRDLVIDKICQLADYGKEIPFSQINVEIAPGHEDVSGLEIKL